MHLEDRNPTIRTNLLKYVFFLLNHQIKVAATIGETDQIEKRPYNRLTVIYDENSAASKHKNHKYSQGSFKIYQDKKRGWEGGHYKNSPESPWGQI